MMSGVAIFCEDIREEKAGTVSIVGILPDNITVPKLPVVFPKLAIYGRFGLAATDDLPTVVVLRLVQTDGTNIALATFDADLLMKAREDTSKKGSSFAGFVSTAIMAPYHVKQPGRMNVMMKVDDGEEVVCGTLSIQVDADEA